MIVLPVRHQGGDLITLLVDLKMVGACVAWSD